MVLTYAAQDVIVPYVIDGIEKRTIVDFRVEALGWDRPLLREIKFRGIWQTRENVITALAVRKAARELGYHYAVITDSYLNAEPRKSNVQRLYKARRKNVPDDVCEYLQKVLVVKGPQMIGEITRDIPVSMLEIFTLIAQGKILANINLPLNDSAPVWWWPHDIHGEAGQ